MSTTGNKLLDLIAARKNQVSKTKTIKPEMGRNRYRILPSWAGEGEAFWKDYGQHFIKDGANKVQAVFVCNDKTFGTPCEVCTALAQGIQHAEDDLTIKRLTDAKANARVLLNVLWLDNGGKCPSDIPQILEVAPSVFNGAKGVGGIISLFSEWPNLVNLQDGVDVIIEKSGTGMETRYGVQVAGSSKPVPANVLEKLHNLDNFVATETAETQRKTLSSLASSYGVRLSLPGAPNPDRPTALLGSTVAENLDATQDAALVALETASGAAVAVAKDVTPPAPAAVAAPVAAAPVADATGDAELDALLAAI